MTGIDSLLMEVLRPYTNEEKSKCMGFQLSNCCGSHINPDSRLCVDCGKESGNECSECPEHKCPNRR